MNLKKSTFLLVLAICAIFLAASLIFISKVKVQNEAGKLEDVFTPQKYSEGWRPLFNGVNLDGWKGFLKPEPQEGWWVEDSMIITRGDSLVHPGDLISIQQFEDFELYLEWAICWQGNSGIFFHSLENSWAPWVMGPEYAIVDQSNLDPMDGIFQTGANYAMHAPSEDCTAPQGQFNSSRIRVKDAKVTHWLNDCKVVEYELWSDDWYHRVKNSKWRDYPQYGRPIKGAIALQGHGFETKFRRIKIKDLTDYGSPLLSILKEDWKQINGNHWIASDSDILGGGKETGLYNKMPENSLNENFTFRFEAASDFKDTLILFFFSNSETDFWSDWLPSDQKMTVNTDKRYLAVPIIFGLISKKINEFNSIVLRRKDNQILVWCNNDMIVEENSLVIPPRLGYVGFYHLGGLGKNIIIKNLYFRIMQ